MITLPDRRNEVKSEPLRDRRDERMQDLRPLKMHSLTQPARDVRSSTSSTAEVSTTSTTDLAQLSLSRPAAHAAIEASDEQAAAEFIHGYSARQPAAGSE